MIRWLHISDLHIKNKADWNTFKKELETKCKKIGKINFVIVTGDFHNFSDKTDFSQAAEFLVQLMKNLQLDIRTDLFVVPGNHDGVSDVLNKNTYISAAMGKPLDLEETWVNTLYEAFADYENFVKGLIPDYPVEHPARVHHRVWNDKINFIHCNTALAADGRQKDNQLLDIDKVASEEYRNDIPNIILAHNSFEDLNTEQRKRILDVIRTNPVCAYLCGDKHIENVEQITYACNQNKQIPCVVSYKSSPDAADNYSVFGMIIGTWEEEEQTASLKGWIWRSGKGFEVDSIITEQEIDMTGRLEKTSETEAAKEEEGTETDEIALACESPDDALGETDTRKRISGNGKRSFVKLYYHMTPAHMEAFNRKYHFESHSLKKEMESEQLTQYMSWADQEGLLEEMVSYMKRMF